MLRITRKTNNGRASMGGQATTITRHIWDFGDSVTFHVGSDITTFEAINRYCINWSGEEVYIDIFSPSSIIGHGPAINQVLTMVRYETDNIITDVHDGIEEIMISMRDPYNEESVRKLIISILSGCELPNDIVGAVVAEPARTVSRKVNNSRAIPRIALANIEVHEKGARSKKYNRKTKIE